MSTLLLNYPEFPESVTPSFGGPDAVKRALANREVVCALKLRGQPWPETRVLMMLAGDRKTVLAFAKSCKRFYTLITDPKGVQ